MALLAGAASYPHRVPETVSSANPSRAKCPHAPSLQPVPAADLLVGMSLRDFPPSNPTSPPDCARMLMAFSGNHTGQALSVPPPAQCLSSGLSCTSGWIHTRTNTVAGLLPCLASALQGGPADSGWIISLSPATPYNRRNTVGALSKSGRPPVGTA